MSVSNIVPTAKGALSGVWDIIVKYILPLGMAFVGYSAFSAVNVGFMIDEHLGGQEMVSKFWKDGYGRLIGAAIFLSVGVSLITHTADGFKGAIVKAIGGFLTGAGLGQLQEGAQKLGVA